jgi:hypothetical protein
MLYINPNKNDTGGYNPPQSTPVQGLVDFPEEHLPEFGKYNGFVILTIEGNVVVNVSPDVEAWEEWKASVKEPEEEETQGADAVTWDELDAAYYEGVNNAYDQ